MVTTLTRTTGLSRTGKSFTHNKTYDHNVLHFISIVGESIGGWMATYICHATCTTSVELLPMPLSQPSRDYKQLITCTVCSHLFSHPCVGLSIVISSSITDSYVLTHSSIGPSLSYIHIEGLIFKTNSDL